MFEYYIHGILPNKRVYIIILKCILQFKVIGLLEYVMRGYISVVM